MAQASRSAASAWSQTSSLPMRGSGRSENLTRNVGEAEVAVDRRQQLDEAHRFGGDLLLGAEDVGVVLGEGAHPHDAVQRAGRLVAVAGAELGQPQRQFAVGPQALAEDLDVARAVHRLQREDLVLVLHRGEEHVLAEFLPVAGAFPQRAVQPAAGSCTSW